MIEIPDIFNVGAPRPIDSRMVKSTLADRDKIPATLLFDGLECFVVENFQKYRYYNSEWHEDIDPKSLSELAGSAIPKGIIAMWSGSVDEIPEGWHLCDGTAGTPNMTGRFIVAAGGKYAIGDTGGSDSVTEVIRHTHGGTATTVTNKTTQSVSISSSGSHNHTNITTNSNGSHSHTIRHYGYYNAEGSNKKCMSWDTITKDGSTNSFNCESAGSHTHTFSITGSGNHTHTFGLDSPAHNHALSINSAGSKTSIDNRPMYYALAFIQKISEGGAAGDEEENDTCIKCLDLNYKDAKIGTFAMHIGDTNDAYRRGFIYEKTSNGWQSTMVMNVIQ